MGLDDMDVGVDVELGERSFHSVGFCSLGTLTSRTRLRCGPLAMTTTIQAAIKKSVSTG